MTDDRKKEINTIINDVVERFDLVNNYTFDSFSRICDANQIILKEADDFSEDGFLTINESEKIIVYAKNDWNWRHNFTIAHELGHFYLNHIDKISGDTIYRSINKCSELEVEANYFASGLLMPNVAFKREFNNMLSKTRILDQICEELSDIFKVSSVSVEYRYENRSDYDL